MSDKLMDYHLSLNPDIGLKFKYRLNSGIYNEKDIDKELFTLYTSNKNFQDTLKDISSQRFRPKSVIFTDDADFLRKKNLAANIYLGSDPDITELTFNDRNNIYVYLNPRTTLYNKKTNREIPLARQLFHGLAHNRLDSRRAERGIFGATPEKAENLILDLENKIFPNEPVERRRDLQRRFRSVIGPKPRLFSPPMNSFAPGTSVLLWNGSEVPIETIQPGDMIASFDERGDFVPGRVREVYQHGTDEFLFLKFKDGRPPLLTTPGHLFLTPDGELKEIIEMVLNGKARLVDESGKPTTVEVMHLIYDAEIAGLLPESGDQSGWVTFNLEVDPHDTFIAGGVRVYDRPDDKTDDEDEMMAEDPLDYASMVTPDGRLLPPREDAPRKHHKRRKTQYSMKDDGDYSSLVTPDGRLIAPTD